jgi:hypothetical protein
MRKNEDEKWIKMNKFAWEKHTMRPNSYWPTCGKSMPKPTVALEVLMLPQIEHISKLSQLLGRLKSQK